MESWIGIYGLLAAVVSMVLDVAQFWERVSKNGVIITSSIEPGDINVFYVCS